jgi:CRISPR/Cas system CSM-associated protein Csm5 (group 7 of RAMP superfamily)
MTLKFCFGNEIHKCPKIPQNFSALLDVIKNIFKDQINDNFVLQYQDSDGDKVMLKSEDDYKSFIESELKTATKAVKIYVISRGANGMNDSLIQFSQQLSISQNLSQPAQNSVGTSSQIDDKAQDSKLVEQYDFIEPKEVKIVKEEIIVPVFSPKKDEVIIEDVTKEVLLEKKPEMEEKKPEPVVDDETKAS